jgi:hypothetical protein
MRFNCEKLEVRTLLSTWYVSASAGAASNPGTLAQPFLTIQQAANLAQPGDTVLIRGGTYRETVVPAHSGLPGQPITYQPYNNEPVTIDGADPVSGWTPYSGSIYQANVAWDLGAGQNQVFVDGQMMTEARWPNTSLDVDHPTFALTTSATSTVTAPDTLTSATIGVPLNDPAGTWVGATIHISPGPSWVMQTGTVTASSPGSLTYTYEQLNAEAPTAGNSFFLTGLFRTLNSPSQWYIDNTGKLSLWTPQGDSAAGHSVEVKHRLYGFDLSGDSYINVNGVNLFATSINTSATSSNNTISGISAEYVSNNWINAYPWGIQYAPHTSGIILNGSANTLQNSTIRYSSGDGVFLGGSGNSVLNCVVADTDYAAGDEAGISTLGSNEQVIGNTVYNAGRGGVVIRHTTASSVLHNVVHDVGLQETDLGAIYTWGTDGQGTQIGYNLIYNVHSAGFGVVGVYLDNTSSNYVVDHNVVWNADFGLKLNPPSATNRIYDNTFTGTQDSLATSGNADMTGTILENNIFSGPFQGGTGTTQSNNLFSLTDPLFVDPANGNFQLRTGSPAIDAGLVIAPYTNGYLGAAPDEGAYESGTAPFTAGSTLPPFPVAGGTLSPPTITPGSTTATFLRADTTSQGTWTKSYGADGYSLFDSGINPLPAYAQVSASNQQAAGWSYSTTDPRALLASPTSQNRIASCYFSPSSFSLNVNLTDGAVHRVSVYMVDYDYQNRAETVQVSDASSGAILDTRLVTNFSGGQYLSWNLSGHVKITFTNSGGNNALVNAIFFDPPSAVATQPTANLLATSQSSGVLLNWTASTAPNLAGYEIYRGSAACGPFSQLNVAPLTGTSYVDATAPQATNVYYEVAAVANTGIIATPATASLAASSVSLSSSVSPTVFGQTVSLNAAVSGLSGTPTGSVIFKDGSTTLATVAVNSSGHAVFSTSAFAVGAHSLTATYSGDSAFDASTSQALPQQIAQAATSAVVLSSVATSTIAQLVTFTATVAASAPGAGVPTGAVTFSDGSTALATVPLNATGSATFTPASLALGSHSITVSYSGDANFLASTSAALTQQVNQASATITLTSSLNPAVVGQPVVFTAKVASNSPGVGTPTGTITFNDGSTVLGTATLDNTGSTSFNASSLLVGSHSITATYSGDVNFVAGVSSALAERVNTTAPVASTTALASSPSPTIVGQSVTFTANVAAGASSPNTPTGSVTFLDGTTVLGTSTLNASGVATFNTSGLAIGSHSITASYGGDANFAASASAALIQMVNPPANNATFVKSDATTQGTWTGAYGSDGYALFGSNALYPSYAQVSVTGNQTWVWNPSATDPVALQTAPAATSRIAACDYSGTNFTIDINLTDGKSHQVALYMADYDNLNRAQSVQVTDATTGAVLSTQNVSAFQKGQYLVWNLSGHVKITLTRTGNQNAVAGGLFFDAVAGTPARPVMPTNFAAVGSSSGVSLSWTTSTDPSVVGYNVFRATSAAGPYVQLNGSPLTTPSYSDTTAPIGSASYYQVVAVNSSQIASLPASASATRANPSESASFLRMDATTQGSWVGAYGADGYSLFGDGVNANPSYAQVSAANQISSAWSFNTTDPRALLASKTSTNRVASCYYSPTSFTLDVNLTDGAMHRLSLYMVDYDNMGRSETVQITDAATGAVLDTRSVTNFTGGQYLSWNVSGHVKITISLAGGNNALANGLFFDPAS